MFLSKEDRKSLAEYKKNLERDALLRKELLNAKTNFGLLESFIQKINENPNLVIDVTLNDGTKLSLKTHKSEKKNFFSEVENGL